MNVKITKLTPANVEALNLMAPKVTGLTEVTKTTATFVGVTAGEALRMVQRMQDVAADTYGKAGGPYASLHAVVRKVNALAFAEQENEDRMRVESAKVEEMRDSGALAEGLAAAQARSDARAEADAASDPLMVLLNDMTPAVTSDVEMLTKVAGFDAGELDGAVRQHPDGGLIITAGPPEPKPDAGVAQEIDDAFAELENLERRRAAVVGLATGLTYGATIRPKAWVTAHVDSESLSPVATRVHAAVSDAAIVKAMAHVMRQATAGTAAFETWFRVQPARSGRVAGRLLAASKSGQRRPKRSRRG